jgi:hypothetical protein
MKKQRLVLIFLMMLAPMTWASDSEERGWVDDILRLVGLRSVDSWGPDIEPGG